MDNTNMVDLIDLDWEVVDSTHNDVDVMDVFSLPFPPIGQYPCCGNIPPPSCGGGGGTGHIIGRQFNLI